MRRRQTRSPFNTMSLAFAGMFGGTGRASCPRELYCALAVAPSNPVASQMNRNLAIGRRMLRTMTILVVMSDVTTTSYNIERKRRRPVRCEHSDRRRDSHLCDAERLNVGLLLFRRGCTV